MSYLNEYKINREILATIDFFGTGEEIASAFGYDDDELDAFLKDSADNCTQIDGKYLFRYEDNFNSTDPISRDAFVRPAYVLLKKNREDENAIKDLRIKLRGVIGGRLMDYLDFLMEIGDYTNTLHDNDFLVYLYNVIAETSKELSLTVRKPYFTRSVLKLSKAEFMRGISQHETLELQREALDMITDANVTVEDGLLYLYAGVNEHFGGNLEKGAYLRKKGIDCLEEFDYPGLEEEMAPLLIWDYYLLGDFRRMIAYYENVILPTENRSNYEIFTSAYPPVIFSYFFIGEYNRALILSQRIYKKATDNKDTLAAILIKAIMGRVYIYMEDPDTAISILKEVYEEAKKADYGWGLYYTLFGIAFYYYKNNKYEKARDTLEEAIVQAKSHGFAPINASPFVLDILRSVEENGLRKIEGFEYDEKLRDYISSKNIHMAGVSLRHRALKDRQAGGSSEEVIEKLKQSIALLEKSGDLHELALSAQELAKVYLDAGEEENVAKYANLSWRMLDEGHYHEFPTELNKYVSSQDKIGKLEVALNTQWLELRHMVNDERLAVRLLTTLCRDESMECGIFFSLPNGSLEVQCTQNLDISDKKNPELLRAEAIATAVAGGKKIFANSDEQSVPKMSLGIPFIHDGRTVAVVYMESNLEQRKITEEEQLLLLDFAFRMSDTIVSAAAYKSAAYGDEAEDTIEFAEQMKTDSPFCHSIEDDIYFIRDQITKVAKTNIPVLITGETGVGKEVFAREVFEKSSYKKAFIKVNCGAIPDNLIESELFGYEKGSFTGAQGRKKGYFEVAEGGTVFLDEVGELPLIAQVKLLRVLQEHELMRVGGTESVKVDFRLIAATNKDLDKEVRLGNFREDLYYRLNVVQLKIPPLRNRKKDIPVLADYFIDKFSREFGVNRRELDAQSLIDMLNYSWPGNIREMENMVQKAILFSEGEKVRVEIPGSENRAERVHTTVHNTDIRVSEQEETERRELFDDEFMSDTDILTLDAMEAKYIEAVLKQCGGKVSGKGGAAEKLGLKRTTLISRMKKLGVNNTRGGENK